MANIGSRELRRVLKKQAEENARRSKFCFRCKKYGADHIEAEGALIRFICPSCCACPED